MANTFKGRVYKITPTETRTYDGKEYYSRLLTILVKRFDPETGDLQREDYPTFDFNGQDRCAQLNGLQLNELVEVSYVVQGIKYEKNGETKFFNKVVGYKVGAIDASQSTEQPTAQQPAEQLKPQSHTAPQTAPSQSTDDLPF